MNFRVYVQVPASTTQLFIFFLVLFTMIIDVSMFVIVLCFIPRLVPFLHECDAARIAGWAEWVDGVDELTRWQLQLAL